MKSYVFIFLTILLFSRCVSIKGDIFVDSNRDKTENNLAKIESVVVPLEASMGTDAKKRQSDIQSARKMITDISSEASADADNSAKLNAWSGRLSILESRYSKCTVSQMPLRMETYLVIYPSSITEKPGIL